MKIKRELDEKSERASDKPAVTKVAIAKLQDTDDWYAIFRFRRHDGMIAYLAMPEGDASEVKALSTALRNAGASGGSHRSFKSLVGKLTIASAHPNATVVIRGGWDESARNFAMPDRMLESKTDGDSDQISHYICLNFNAKKKAQLVVKGGSPGGSQSEIDRRGTIKGWQDKVARPALASSYMMTGICAALTAPMLKLLGVSPFTLVLTGDSTTGKTTVTGVGASVVGFATPDQLPTWNITPAGLEERAEIHFDTLLPIDDLNSAPESEKKKFQLINAIAYRITGGAKKHTLSMAKSGITGRPPVKGAIRTIILTSAEDSMADIAAAAKMDLPGGFFSRLIEIPVPKAANGGVYDLARFEGRLSQKVQSARKLSKAIARGCKLNHGYVLKKYIRAIIEDPEHAKQIAARAREEFMGIVAIDRRQAIHWRRAEIFAVMYAAGAYAIALNLLPWTPDDLRKGILKSLAASWTTLPSTIDTLQSGLARLRNHLLRPDKMPPSTNIDNLKIADGWSHVDGEKKTFMILGDRFRQLFESKKQQRRVEKFLRKKGILIPDAKGNPTKQPTLPGCQKKAPRCYELRVPAESGSALFPNVSGAVASSEAKAVKRTKIGSRQKGGKKPS